MTYQTTINVEAVQWTGDNFEEIENWLKYRIDFVGDESGWLILSGKLLTKRAFVNDWIIYSPPHFIPIKEYIDRSCNIYILDPEEFMDIEHMFHPLTQDHLEL